MKMTDVVNYKVRSGSALHRALQASVWVVLSLTLACNAQASSMKNTEFYEANAVTKVFFELTGQPEFKFYQLENPARIVIDLPNVDNNFPLESLGFVSPRVLKLRHSRPSKPQDTRIVIETSGQLDVSVYTKDDTSAGSTSIVVELFDKEFSYKSRANSHLAKN